jgi:hypothetical protein
MPSGSTTSMRDGASHAVQPGPRGRTDSPARRLARASSSASIVRSASRWFCVAMTSHPATARGSTGAPRAGVGQGNQRDQGQCALPRSPVHLHDSSPNHCCHMALDHYQGAHPPFASRLRAPGPDWHIHAALAPTMGKVWATTTGFAAARTTLQAACKGAPLVARTPTTAACHPFSFRCLPWNRPVASIRCTAHPMPWAPARRRASRAPRPDQEGRGRVPDVRVTFAWTQRRLAPRPRTCHAS